MLFFCFGVDGSACPSLGVFFGVVGGTLGADADRLSGIGERPREPDASSCGGTGARLDGYSGGCGDETFSLDPFRPCCPMGSGGVGGVCFGGTGLSSS